MGEQRRYKGVGGICRRVRGYMGEQRRYKGVGSICRRVRGYMGEQKRYKKVEGICRSWVRGHMGEQGRYNRLEGICRRVQGTYTLYSLVSSLYSVISPYPSNHIYPLTPLYRFCTPICSRTLIHIPSTLLYRLCFPYIPVPF